ncbi:MAG: LIC_10190 family membrane protein, partial [Kaistella sp.]
MLYILFSFIFIVPVLSGWGKFSERILGSLSTGISWNIFSGILTISVVWTVLSFITPLNIFVEIPTVLLGFFFFFKNKLYQHISLHCKKNYLVFVIILVILYCGSFYPYMIDHFGYYVPTIKWLNEFGLVKGVSNLN